MYFIQAEAPCSDDKEAVKWWDLAYKHGFVINRNDDRISITGRGTTKERAQEVADFVEKYPVHSIFMMSEPDEEGEE